MMYRKGISQAVSWVLLLGLSISLAISVGVWLKNISKETGDEVVNSATRDQRCADTVLAVIEPTICPSLLTNCNNFDYNVKIKNTGVFSITKVICSKLDGQPYEISLGIPLAPNAEQVLNSCEGADITIIPFIEIEKQQIACADKGVRFEANCQPSNCI